MANKIKYTPDMFDEDRFNNKKHSVAQKILFVVLSIYVAFLVVFMGLYFDFKSKYYLIPVTGMSMQPILNPNTTEQEDCDDYVYVRSGKSFTYNDIVVFDAGEYNGEEERLIKRVVAIEGDLVSIRLEYSEVYEQEVFTVFIVRSEFVQDDGTFNESDVLALQEDYVKDVLLWTYGGDSDPFAAYKKSNEFCGAIYENRFLQTYILDDINDRYKKHLDSEGNFYVQVPEGEFFYLGDNRYISSDSRTRGTESVEAVLGVVDVEKIVKNASSSPMILVQIRSVFEHYGKIIGSYFSNLWVDLENYFAI